MYGCSGHRAGDILKDFETGLEFKVAYFKNKMPHDEQGNGYKRFRTLHIASQEEHESYMLELEGRGIIDADNTNLQ